MMNVPALRDTDWEPVQWRKIATRYLCWEKRTVLTAYGYKFDVNCVQFHVAESSLEI
jgi:hypothetical protein